MQAWHWFVVVMFILLGITTLLKTSITQDRISEFNRLVAYTKHRLDGDKKFISFSSNYNKVIYVNKTGYDLNNSANIISAGGLLFSFSYSDITTGYVFVPKNTLGNGKYIFNSNDTKLEYIKANNNIYSLLVGKGILGDYYYSGNNNTGYLYNGLDNSKICYFDSVTSDCK